MASQRASQLARANMVLDCLMMDPIASAKTASVSQPHKTHEGSARPGKPVDSAQLSTEFGLCVLPLQAKVSTGILRTRG